MPNIPQAGTAGGASQAAVTWQRPDLGHQRGLYLSEQPGTWTLGETL